jgi:hypothetical protein
MRLAVIALTGLLVLLAGAGLARAQLVKPAPSSPTSEAIGPTPPAAPGDDRIGKIGLNFGVGPVLLLNLDPVVRKLTETGFGLSARFGYELRFGLIPEITFDFAHDLLKGQAGGASANAIAIHGGARYIFRRGLLNPFLNVGGGYFINLVSNLTDPTVLGSAASFNAGAGLDVRVHTNSYLELQIRYLGYFDGALVSTLLFNAALTLYY